MQNFSRYIKLLSIIFILMLAVNTAVLLFFFDVRLSDIADFAAYSFGSVFGDGFQNGDSSFDRDSSPEGDASSQRDNSPEGDVSPKRDGPSEWDGSAEAGGSSEGDSSQEGDTPPEFSIEMGDVINIINGLSFQDKIALASMAAKMGSEGLEKVYDMSKDGITSDELHSIKEYAEAHLKPSDIAKLEEIIRRNEHLYADSGK